MTTQEERQRLHDREERLVDARDLAARAYWRQRGHDRLQRLRDLVRGDRLVTLHARNCTCLFCKRYRPMTHSMTRIQAGGAPYSVDWATTYTPGPIAYRAADAAVEALERYQKATERYPDQ